MMFVDGENLTLRGQALAERAQFKLREGEYFQRDTFLWIPGRGLTLRGANLQMHPRRSHYYSMVQGDAPKVNAVRQALRELSFQPTVLAKKGKRHAKGVDIRFAADLLSHAFRDNYDTAVLIAGDGDYIPLVEEVQRIGKRVLVAFFQTEGFNDELRLVADQFEDLTRPFVDGWFADRHERELLTVRDDERLKPGEFESFKFRSGQECERERQEVLQRLSVL